MEKIDKELSAIAVSNVKDLYAKCFRARCSKN